MHSTLTRGRVTRIGARRAWAQYGYPRMTSLARHPRLGSPETQPRSRVAVHRVWRGLATIGHHGQCQDVRPRERVGDARVGRRAHTCMPCQRRPCCHGSGRWCRGGSGSGHLILAISGVPRTSRVAGVFLGIWAALLGPANATGGVRWAQGPVMSAESMHGGYSPYKLAPDPTSFPFSPGPPACAALLSSWQSFIAASFQHLGVSGCAHSGGRCYW